MYEQYCLCLFTECDAQPRTPRRINELSVSFLCRCVLVGVVPGVVCHAFYNIIKYAYFIFLPISSCPYTPMSKIYKIEKVGVLAPLQQIVVPGCATRLCPYFKTSFMLVECDS